MNPRFTPVIKSFFSMLFWMAMTALCVEGAFLAINPESFAERFHPSPALVPSEMFIIVTTNRVKVTGVPNGTKIHVWVDKDIRVGGHAGSWVGLGTHGRMSFKGRTNQPVTISAQ